MWCEVERRSLKGGRGKGLSSNGKKDLYHPQRV